MFQCIYSITNWLIKRLIDPLGEESLKTCLEHKILNKKIYEYKIIIFIYGNNNKGNKIKMLTLFPPNH